MSLTNKPRVVPQNWKDYLSTGAPSIDKGEITDKGSLNQRAVLSNRKALVSQLGLVIMNKYF
jgi:hypothetical protein